ncbi:MAG: crossover junction endodeoxyribonuclease RuvC [Bacteroidia bacterium]|nr:crossover junction endodeoxyribonuclease RuvC [Bacteroidia bacterium]
MKEKIILGVDPGTTITGYGLISCKGKKLELITYGVIKLGKLTEASHPQKLKKIYDRITSIVLEYKPDEFAIESPFHGKNIQAMLKLGRAQGVAIAAALAVDIPVFEYAPKKVKMAVTGNGNASKEKVSGMLEYILNFKYEEALMDASDALAIAVCHSYQNEATVTGGKGKGWASFLAANPDRIKK